MKKLLLLVIMLSIFMIGCSKEFFVDVTKQGTPVTKFNLEDFNGKVMSSDKVIDGKPTLFLIVAEWCPHCKVELPYIEQFYNEYKDRVNVIVVFSNADSSLEKAKEFYTSNGYTFPVYYDEDGSILRGFGVNAFPFSLKIIDGKVDKVLDLPVTYDKLVTEFGK